MASRIAFPEEIVQAPQSSLGLRSHVLSPLETLAQSISSNAPSTSPSMTIPLVFALAGPGTWLSYLLALVCMGLMAFAIAIFARDTASPGSLYAYTRSTLPPMFSVVSAWALLFAYVMTAASMIGGLITYGYPFLGRFGHHLPPSMFAILVTAFVVWIAYRDIRISTQAMLLITFVLAAILWKHGFHLDMPQFRLHRSDAPGVRLGVILAVFSFVGFESATTLGAEARSPLRTIPRAVINSALIAGAFFTLSAYTEVLGFGGTGQALDANTAPLRFLSEKIGFGVLSPFIDCGVVISMFACILACVIAAARVLLQMAHHGLAHGHLRKMHAANETPLFASVAVGAVVAVAPAILAQRGATGADIYGWMGSCAVYGFLTAYGMVAVSLPFYLHRRGRLTAGALLLAIAALGAAILATLGSLFPVPPAPYRYLPYIYLAYLVLGIGWYAATNQRQAAHGVGDEPVA